MVVPIPEIRVVFFNASNRMACQIITDRGVAMIPLPRWGYTLDWRRTKKKGKAIDAFGRCLVVRSDFSSVPAGQCTKHPSLLRGNNFGWSCLGQQCGKKWV